MSKKLPESIQVEASAFVEEAVAFYRKSLLELVSDQRLPYMVVFAVASDGMDGMNRASPYVTMLSRFNREASDEMKQRELQQLELAIHRAGHEVLQSETQGRMN